MSSQRNVAAVIGTVTAVLFTACASSPTMVDRNASLIGGLRSIGFECADLIGAQALDQEGDSWRIVCTDARAYLASFETEGEICISPVPYLAPPGSILQAPIIEAVVRCTHLGNREG